MSKIEVNKPPSTELVPYAQEIFPNEIDLDVGVIPHEEIVLEAPGYEPPEQAPEIDAREVSAEKKLRLILYVGEKATLDLVHVDESDEPGFLVKRMEDSRERHRNLFQHPQEYMSPEEAKYFFDGYWAA